MQRKLWRLIASDLSAQHNDPLLWPGKASDELLEKMPPTVMVEDEFDFYITEAERFARRLRAAGRLLEYVEFPGCTHGMHLFPIAEEEWKMGMEIGNQSEFVVPNIDNPDVAKTLKDSIRSDRMNAFITPLVGSYKNRFGFLPLSNYGVEAPNWIYEQWAEISSSRADIEIAKYSHSEFFSTEKFYHLN